MGSQRQAALRLEAQHLELLVGGDGDGSYLFRRRKGLLDRCSGPRRGQGGGRKGELRLFGAGGFLPQPAEYCGGFFLSKRCCLRRLSGLFGGGLDPALRQPELEPIGFLLFFFLDGLSRRGLQPQEAENCQACTDAEQGDGLQRSGKGPAPVFQF